MFQTACCDVASFLSEHALRSRVFFDDDDDDDDDDDNDELALSR